MVSRFVERLRYGVAKDQLRFPFERQAAPVYWIIAAQLIGAFTLQYFLDFRLPLSTIKFLPLWPLFLCPAALLARRYGHGRLAGSMEATALIYGQGVSVLMLLIPLTAISAPFSDASLANADRALGFNWPAFVYPFAHDRTAASCVVFFYNSFKWQPALILVILFSTGHEHRAWKTVLAGTIAASVTAIIYPFAPALGAYTHFHIAPNSVPRFVAGWDFAPILQSIKLANVRTVTPEMFTGLVSFPSYHAAAALIFVWAIWSLRKLRLPFLMLNAGLAISAVVGGGHYLVDILAGLFIAVASIWLANPRNRVRSLLPQKLEPRTRAA